MRLFDGPGRLHLLLCCAFILLIDFNLHLRRMYLAVGSQKVSSPALSSPRASTYELLFIAILKGEVYLTSLANNSHATQGDMHKSNI